MKNPVLSGPLTFRFIMKKITVTFIITLVSSIGYAQSLSISNAGNTAANATSEFNIAGHTLTINGAFPSYAASDVSADVNTITAVGTSIHSNGVSVFAGNGSAMYNPSYKLLKDDESARIYAMANGGFIIRENIANFLFYDATGSIRQSISNSSQSTEGESVSELASDPLFKTVVLYNPKIVRNGVEGSRARIVEKNWTTSDIFYSNDRAIRSVKVSADGQYVAIISYRSGTDDEVEITDRFGNDISRVSFSQDVQDVRFSKDGEFVTILSGSRVGVYSLLDGEREGSTSFRSRLYFAEYIPQDDAIVALTANEQNGVLTEVEVHAINLDARKIERQEYGSTLGISALLPVQLMRTGSDRYILTGLSKTLEIRVSY